MKAQVWLLTSGDGSDGNEWGLISIHSSEELALLAKAKYEAPRSRYYSSTYCLEANIEEWSVDA